MKALAVIVCVVLAGCSGQPTREACEFARGEVRAADACRADAECSVRGFTFPQVEDERVTLARCRP